MVSVAIFLCLASTCVHQTGDRASSVVRISPDMIYGVQRYASFGDAGQRNRSVAGLSSLLVFGEITIGVSQDGLSIQNQGFVMNAVSKAIEVWSPHIEGTQIKLTPEFADANVKVRFVDQLPAGRDTQGFIKVERRVDATNQSDKYKMSAELTVLRTVRNRQLTQDEMTEVIAHELGHLFGLDDHDLKSGIMGPFVPGKPRLSPSQSEIDALVNFRDQIKKSIRRADAIVKAKLQSVSSKS